MRGNERSSSKTQDQNKTQDQDDDRNWNQTQQKESEVCSQRCERLPERGQKDKTCAVDGPRRIVREFSDVIGARPACKGSDLYRDRNLSFWRPGWPFLGAWAVLCGWIVPGRIPTRDALLFGWKGGVPWGSGRL